MKNRNRVMIMTAVLLIGLAMWLPGLKSRRVAAQSPGLTGSFGFTLVVPSTPSSLVPSGAVGVIAFDGAGNVTGSQTYVSPDASPDARTVQVGTLKFTGTYTVNVDGTGTFTLDFGDGKPIPVAIVITDGGTQFSFVQTGGGNSLLMGTGRKQ